MSDDWCARVRTEIRGISTFWVEKYGWNPHVAEEEAHIDLFVTFTRRISRPDRPSQQEVKTYVLRLRYQSDFETAGRRENFVNGENFDEEGILFWPAGVAGINPTHNPPTICLEGTFGFHSIHHKDRDGRVASLNRLLIEIQQCMKK